MIKEIKLFILNHCHDKKLMQMNRKFVFVSRQPTYFLFPVIFLQLSLDVYLIVVFVILVKHIEI